MPEKPLAVRAAAVTLQLLAVVAAAAPITVQLSLAQLEHAASADPRARLSVLHDHHARPAGERRAGMALPRRVRP
jgi:hypothetical protein